MLDVPNIMAVFETNLWCAIIIYCILFVQIPEISGAFFLF